jgi:hypothetical protein
MRATDYAMEPEYILNAEQPQSSTSSGVLVPGRQDDIWLVSAMGAVANHPVDDLSTDSGGSMIETIFGSAPDDFKHFGVYTVRIYKNGVWAEVVTDTRVPCAPLTKELGKLVQVIAGDVLSSLSFSFLFTCDLCFHSLAVKFQLKITCWHMKSTVSLLRATWWLFQGSRCEPKGRHGPHHMPQRFSE